MRINNIEKFRNEVAANLNDVFYNVRQYEKVEYNSIVINNPIAIDYYYIEITKDTTFIFDHKFKCVSFIEHNTYINKVSYSMALAKELMRLNIW